MAVVYVADSAFVPEQVEQFAKLLARSPLKRAVFTEVYRGQQQRPRTAAELGARTTPRLSAKRVLEIAGPLARHKLFERTKGKGVVAYKKYPHIAANRDEILRLAQSPKKLAAHVTVRKPKIVVTVRTKTPRADVFVDARHLTIDGIDNFKRVRQLPARSLPKKLSDPLPEQQFKTGFAAILGTKGTFKDWGGEKHDLFSTELAIGGKRRAAAVGFKGPAKKPPLTPGKMGKNGDQIQRLFHSPAQVYLVQFEGQIVDTVLEQLQKFAMVQSQRDRATVWYGIIDGADSARLRLAYKSSFRSLHSKSKS